MDIYTASQTPSRTRRRQPRHTQAGCRRPAEPGRPRTGGRGVTAAPNGATTPAQDNLYTLNPVTGQLAATFDWGALQLAQKHQARRARSNRKALVRNARARKLIERKKDQLRLRKEIEELW